MDRHWRKHKLLGRGNETADSETTHCEIPTLLQSLFPNGNTPFSHHASPKAAQIWKQKLCKNKTLKVTEKQ